jgi:transposase
MKAIHGGKAKNDRIDSQKIAVLLRGGMIPVAYVYPPQMRSTRDLLRRRTYLMRKRAELLVHVQHTNSQYNLPEIGKKIAYRANRSGVAQRFSDPAVQTSIAADLSLIDFYDTLLNQLELFITRQAKQQDQHSFYLLRSVPGVGKILALTILYEIHDIDRFPRVQEFVSYCRLVKCSRQSAGKNYGFSGKKDRQCASQVGLLGSGCLIPPQQPGRTETRGSPGAQAWQGQSVDYPGAQAGPRRLFHLTKGESL